MQSADHPPTETLPSGLPTTLKRPPEKMIRSFRPWMIGNDTIAILLGNGWSLGVCCRHCSRTIEMKPEAITAQFGAHPGLRLIDLLPRMSCGEPKGCGSRDVVLFPWREKSHPAKRKEAVPTGELSF